MTAKIYVTLKPGVLDPQGQAVGGALSRLGFPEVKSVRIGKYIELEFDGAAPKDSKALDAKLKKMCEGLLANTVIETFRWELAE